MRSHLESLDWSSLISSSENCETNYGKVHDILQRTLDKYAPMHTIKLKKKKVSEPWITKGIINCQRRQKLLYKKSIRLENQNVTMNNVTQYKLYRSILQKCKRSAKQQYYKEKCTDLRNNTKKLWQLINGIINKTSHKHHVIEKINKNGNILSNSQEISNEFGRYFSSIGKNFADATKQSKLEVGDYSPKIVRNNSTLYLYPTNKMEITKLLSKLPKKQAVAMMILAIVY